MVIHNIVRSYIYIYIYRESMVCMVTSAYSVVNC